MSLIDTSDKVFWHGYVDFYEKFFQNREFINIAEIGILKGNSVKWMLEKFPEATIYGADILPVQPEWPTVSRFKFTQLDQGNKLQLNEFLSQTQFDLIIEDGSHIPQHQVLCLLECLKAIKSGGLYILEDIHTSHPAYNNPSYPASMPVGNALSVLLAIDHYKRIGVNIDQLKANLIANNSMITADGVLYLSENLSKISLYKRTHLPNYCYACGSTDFNFSTYKCKCGVDVFSDTDSMSFVLEKV